MGLFLISWSNRVVVLGNLTTFRKHGFVMAAARETGNYLNMKPRSERPRLRTTLLTKVE